MMYPKRRQSGVWPPRSPQMCARWHLSMLYLRRALALSSVVRSVFMCQVGLVPVPRGSAVSVRVFSRGLSCTAAVSFFSRTRVFDARLPFVPLAQTSPCQDNSRGFVSAPFGTTDDWEWMPAALLYIWAV